MSPQAPMPSNCNDHLIHLHSPKLRNPEKSEESLPTGVWNPRTRTLQKFKKKSPKSQENTVKIYGLHIKFSKIFSCNLCNGLHGHYISFSPKIFLCNGGTPGTPLKFMDYILNSHTARGASHRQGAFGEGDGPTRKLHSRYVKTFCQNIFIVYVV